MDTDYRRFALETKKLQEPMKGLDYTAELRRTFFQA